MQDEPVAIIGAAIRFPGEVRSLTSLWRLLMGPAARLVRLDLPAR
ncbi:hypothetical protein ACPXCS_22580 [Streptomyces sp. DT190]